MALPAVVVVDNAVMAQPAVVVVENAAMAQTVRENNNSFKKSVFPLFLK